MNKQELLQHNYTKGGNNYILLGNTKWIAFTRNIIDNKLKPKFGNDFNLIVYWSNGSEKDCVDYICVPYSKVSHLLTEEHLTGRNTNRERWNFIIKDGLFCVHANTKHSIKIASYLNKEISSTENHKQHNLSGKEGDIKLKLHKSIERNTKLITQLKRKRKQIDPLLHCDICGFSFMEKYGNIGDGFIEAHHILPLHKLGQATITKEDDLIFVCSNCHRMLHRTNSVLDYTKLQNIIQHC